MNKVVIGNMIPKIIHYCWMSDDAYPEKIKKCIDSWKKYLPDYEIKQWSYSIFPRGASRWVDQAFDAKKFAFCADYLRVYAVYHYGGIYLDSDVEVIKSFDDLLTLPYFFGKEASVAGVEAAVFGAEKGFPLLKALLDRYNKLDFFHNDGTMDMYPMPNIFRRLMDSEYIYHPISTISEFVEDESFVNVFPVDFFSPKDFMTGEIVVTDNTYSIHHFSGSWLVTNDTISFLSPPHTKIHFLKLVLRKLKTFIMFNKKDIVISNMPIDKEFSLFYGMTQQSPLCSAVMTHTDYQNLLSLLIKNQIQLTLEFIKRDDAKCIFSNDFYPICKVQNSDIEIHYVDEISRENILNKWKNFYIHKENGAKIISIISNEDLLQNNCINWRNHRLMIKIGFYMICNIFTKENKFLNYYC